MSIIDDINNFFDNLDDDWQRIASNLDVGKTISAFAALGGVISLISLFSNYDVVRGWQFTLFLFVGAVLGAIAGGVFSFTAYFWVRIAQVIFWIFVVIFAITAFIIFLGSIIWQS